MALTTIQRIPPSPSTPTNVNALTIGAGGSLNLDGFIVQLTTAAYQQEGLYLLVEAVDGAAALTGTPAGIQSYTHTAATFDDSFRPLGQLVVRVRRTY